MKVVKMSREFGARLNLTTPIGFAGLREISPVWALAGGEFDFKQSLAAAINLVFPAKAHFPTHPSCASRRHFQNHRTAPDGSGEKVVQTVRRILPEWT